MRNLKTLLERFTSSLNKDEILKEQVVDVVLRRIGLKLPVESISIKDGILIVSAGGVAKNEIMLKSEAILEELRFLKVPVSKIIYK